MLIVGSVLGIGYVLLVEFRLVTALILLPELWIFDLDSDVFLIGVVPSH